jgi:hypothetical protein
MVYLAGMEFKRPKLHLDAVTTSTGSIMRNSAVTVSEI